MATSGDEKRRHVDILSRSDIFGCLPREELRRLVELSRTMVVPPRTIVVEQGEPADRAYAILSGRLKAVTPGADGRDATLGIMDPGEVFGEIALLDGGPRSARVVAIERAELFVVQRGDLFAILAERPEASLQMLTQLALRLRRLTERVEATSASDISTRLARMINALGQRYGEPNADGVRLAIRLSQSDLAEMIGATRESVNKHIKKLSEVLKHERGVLTILDPARLREVAESDSPD